MVQIHRPQDDLGAFEILSSMENLIIFGFDGKVIIILVLFFYKTMQHLSLMHIATTKLGRNVQKLQKKIYATMNNSNSSTSYTI